MTAAGRTASSVWARLRGILSSGPVRLGLFLAATALGAVLLYRSLAQYSLEEIRAAVVAIPLPRLGAALGFAAASYACLTLFDFIALRCIGRQLAYGRAALASFVSLSLGHTIGFAGVSSGAIRYRFYARWGLDAAEVARLVLFCGVTVALGLTTLAGLVLMMDPSTAQGLLPLSDGEMGVLATGCLCAPALYLLLAGLPQRILPRRALGLPRPPLSLAAAQIVAGTANYACVAACLLQVMRAVADVDFPAVASAYVAANAATLITHVPGGVGVVESVVQHLIPGTALFGALLVFRFVYFILPLALGLLILAADEVTRRHRDRDVAAHALSTE